MVADLNDDSGDDLLIVTPSMVWVNWFPSMLEAAACADGLEPTCPPLLDEMIETADLSLEIGSSSGAAGDVVPVTVVLHSKLNGPGGLHMSLSVCHDPDVAEVVGDPVYTDEFLSILWGGAFLFFAIDEEVEKSRNDRGHGFVQFVDILEKPYAARFPSEVPMPLMTVYYRLKGKPGDTGKLEFCDYVLEFANTRCTWNGITSVVSRFSGGYNRYEFLPGVKRGGVLAVLEGPVTRPDRPPEPPKAKVYAGRPSDEEVNFRVRVEGARALPGAEAVPARVFVSADVEYTGMLLPLRFDPRYVRLARAEQHFIGGIASTRYPGCESGGCVVIYSGQGIGNRRLAAGGEEIPAATLYFDVLAAARQVAETRIEVGGPAEPWIGVRHRESAAGIEGPVVRSEIAPIRITNGSFLVHPSRPARQGDVDLDGRFDISDALALLSHLFQGGPPPRCPGAGDFNRDGRLNVTDPIGMLTALFMEGQREAEEVPCH